MRTAPLLRRYPPAIRLEKHLTSYSVHLIVALIALPSLIWHISSTHVLDDYGMPDDWVDSFNETHFTGGRGWLWGFLFAVIPIDCVHALLTLDYYHGRRYERGHDDDIADATKAPARQHRPFSPIHARPFTTTSAASTVPPTTKIPLPTHPPHTYHPLLSPLFPSSLRLSLITLYDITISAFLFIHITNFFHVLDTNWKACNTYTSPYPEHFLDPMKTNMTVLERCQKICTDIYVSGGFDVALCVILLGVHFWHLGLRAWEALVFGVGREDWTEKEGVGPRDGSEGVSVRMDGDGAQSTAIRYRDWSAEGKPMQVRSRAREVDRRSGRRSSSIESTNWSEVLLECLVP